MIICIMYITYIHYVYYIYIQYMNLPTLMTVSEVAIMFHGDTQSQIGVLFKILQLYPVSKVPFWKAIGGWSGPYPADQFPPLNKAGNLTPTHLVPPHPCAPHEQCWPLFPKHSGVPTPLVTWKKKQNCNVLIVWLHMCQGLNSLYWGWSSHL